MKTAVLFRWISLLIVLLFQTQAFSQTFGTVQIKPSSTPTGIGVTVLVTAQITDLNVIPSSVNLQKIDLQGRATVIGTMHDDGLNGDVAANDKTYSISFSVFEQQPGAFTYRASAAIKGKVTRVLSSPIAFTISGTVATNVAITQPANLAFVNTSPIIVSGSVGDPGATVAINGIQATKGGTTYQTTVPLQEGNNTITAVATNSNGTKSTASIQVTLDTTPPRVVVDSPPAGHVTTEATITVTGMINDIVVGTVNSQQAQVTVNGVSAPVVNRSFVAKNVPLQIGNNTIQVIGKDQTGNSATTSVTVKREAITGTAIKIMSGNNQSALIGTQLPAPLVVQLANGATPITNKPIIFKITQNDGFLQPGVAKAQTVIVNTNVQGQAQALHTLGSRAGAGNNTVEAYALGIPGTLLFTSSGNPKPAAKINVDAGNNQFGAVNQALALPFVAVVTDQGNNRLAGVPVTFTVKQGGGTIKGASTVQTTSDSDGRVLAVLTLGSQPGQDNNLIEATFTGNAGFAAAFTASGKVPGNPAATTISGVVQDNSNNSIANVTMRLFKTNQGSNNNQPTEVGTPVKTDAKGIFKITSAPVGFFKLMADGTTATGGGKLFPTLEYDIVTVAGQDNTVGSPIYLPELDPLAKLCVDATTGGVLKLSKSPGFSLSIVPGSATFPGGSKTGCVTVTPVNPDKVPMVPGFGQQPRYVVTIQPVGTTFNPPAAISIPNMDGLAPNAKTEMYSFDHDLASFVAIGTGTVSADGSIIASDPGVGVIKAGWHCGGNPNTTGSAGTCPECQKCDGSSCVPISASLGCNDNLVCTENDQCVGGICRGTPIDTSSVLDNGSVGEKAKLPPDLVDGINKFINKVPGLGGITFNTLDVTGTGKLRACCGESVGYLKTGREEKAVEVSLGFEFKDKPLGALGNKANILIDVGIGIVQLDVVVGVLFSSNVAIKAKGGKIDDKCKPETCEFGSLNAAFTPGLKLELTAEVCFLSSGNSVSCTGFIVQPVSATFPLSLGIDVNGRGCNSGISGVGKAGPLKVTFSYKFLLGSIPLQGSYNYEPPFASGFECRLPGGCG